MNAKTDENAGKCPIVHGTTNLGMRSNGSVATSKAVTEDGPSGTGRRGLRQPDRTVGR
jgi:hypothetical protein